MKNRLREIRKEMNLTQDELAKKAGLSRATINSVENNTAIPNGDTIEKIVIATNKPANEIFFDLDVVLTQQTGKEDDHE